MQLMHMTNGVLVQSLQLPVAMGSGGEAARQIL